jgi:hypothetical protein
VLRVALLCTSRMPSVQLSIRSVVHMLEDVAAVQEQDGKGAIGEVQRQNQTYT